MLEKLHVLAPAKINIGLKVLQKRDDGYHGIESIFSTVDLSDELDVQVKSSKNQCVVTTDVIELPRKNTITVAYDALKKLLKSDLPSVNVFIKKQIPSGGGLGGGSSDAASFLLALNKMLDLNLTNLQFNKLASVVGSDVFFFLNCGINNTNAAIVTGRGECVKPIPKRKDLHYLLVFPRVHSSTKEAYNLIDEFYESGNKLEYPSLEELEFIYQNSVCKWNFVNTFTNVISKKYSVIQNAIDDIKNNGSLYTDMSGSGSTVFGVFESQNDLQNACNALSCSWNVSACS